jgi:hypothetical protein
MGTKNVGEPKGVIALKAARGEFAKLRASHAHEDAIDEAELRLREATVALINENVVGLASLMASPLPPILRTTLNRLAAENLRYIKTLQDLWGNEELRDEIWQMLKTAEDVN